MIQALITDITERTRAQAAGRKHVETCLIQGSARFDWMASAPNELGRIWDVGKAG